MEKNDKVRFCDGEIGADFEGGRVTSPLENTFLTIIPTHDVVCDWLSFTFPCRLLTPESGDAESRARFEKLLEVLKLDVSIAESVRGSHNYAFGLSWLQNTYLNKEVKTVFFYGVPENGKDYLTRNANGEQTSFFDLTGGSCREFERRWNYDHTAWKRLMDVMDECRAKASRFDLAIDLFDTPFNVVQFLRDKQREGLLVTPFKKFEDYRQYEDKYDNGDTLYIGSRKGSDMFVRVYDKMAECHGKGVDHLVEHKNWYRIEFKCAHRKAEQMRQLFSQNQDDLWSLALKLLNKYIQPKMYGKDLHNGNVYRLMNDQGWLDLLENSDPDNKVSLKNTYGGDKTIEKSMEWGRRSLSGVLALWAMALGYTDFALYIDVLVGEGSKKLTEKELKLCDNFRKETGRPEIGMFDVQRLIDIAERARKESEYAIDYSNS